MRTLYIDVDNFPTQIIGFGGENGVTAISLDYSKWAEEFGEGTMELVVRRSMDSEQYLAPLTVEDNIAVLTVSDVETSYKGHGEMQYVYTVGEVIKKSPVFGFNVSRSLDSQVVETPEAFRSWVTQVLNAAAEAKQAVTEAEGYVTEAQGYAEQASASATASAQSATEASGYANDAKEYSEQTAGYVDDAVEYADASRQHAEQSATSAGNSAQSATESASSATASAQSASEASESAQSAEESAEQAQQTADQFASEISVLKEDLTNKADIIINSASGAIASFSDGANYPVKSATFTMNPIQDLHGQEYPYPAGGGKNLFDLNGFLDDRGASYTVNGDVYTITPISDLYTNPFVFSDTDIPVTISLGSFSNITSTVIRVDLLNTNNTVVTYAKEGGLVVTGTGCKIRINWSRPGTFSMSKVMVEKGSTATAYAPYENICPISGHTSVDACSSPTTDPADGQSVTYQLGQTVYAGTLTVNEDGSGTITSTLASVDLGVLAWAYNPNLNGKPAFYVLGMTDAKAPVNNSTVANMITSIYKPN